MVVLFELYAPLLDIITG